MNNIFPSSITQFSTEHLIKKHSTKSKAIYWIIIISILLIVLSLFLISVDVTVHSPGIITSEEKATHIAAPVFGKILSVKIHENDFVNQGDTLVIIDPAEIQNNIKIIQKRLTLLEQQNTDLRSLSMLTKNNYSIPLNLITELYQQEAQRFISELKYYHSETEILKKEYLRQKFLYKKRVISTADFEQAFYKYTSSKLNFNKLFETQLAEWQNRLNQNNTQVYNLKETLNHLRKEYGKHYIRTPINGYIQSLSGIKTSGNIYPNQEICIISPASDLIVETWVSTSDIGLIKPEQKVRLRVDAFNYNQWGMLNGEVTKIANDVIVSKNGIPSFKIKCKLYNLKLTYNNKTVKVKKGMTVNTNFLLTQRTLAQLLYDNITKWLDPNDVEKGKTISYNTTY